MENFGKFMTLVMAMIISPIVSGFVTMKLWFWFMVPIFGMNPLRLVEAIGLMFLINYLKFRKTKPTDKDKFWLEFTESIITVILIAAVALFSGWIVQKFM
jgi:hypothetical protein